MNLALWRVLCVWTLTVAWGCSAASASLQTEQVPYNHEHEQTGLFLPAAAICAAIVSALLAVLRQRRAAAKASDHRRAHFQNYQSGTILGHERPATGPRVHNSELLGPGHGDPVTADCLQHLWGDWLDSCKPFKAPAQQFYSPSAPEELHAPSPANSPLFADCLLSTGCTLCSPSALDAPGWSGQSEVQRSVAGCAQLVDSCRVPYVSKLGACTVHIKVPFIEPEQLPVDFFEKIQAGLQARASGHFTIVGGAVRRGCVELAMDIITTRAAMMPQYQPPPDNPDGAGPPRDPEGVLVEGEAAKSASLAYSRPGGNWSQGGRMGTPPGVSGSQAGPSAGASGMALVEGMSAADQGVFGDADLQGLTPLDWVHWLYLQPPAEAEVLVQACGRSFITCWDAERQHWLTHEMSATDSQGNRLPDRLPRVVHVDPPCVALCGHETELATVTEGLTLASASMCVPAAATPLRLLVVGHNLHQAHSSVAARFLGVYLSVESRPLYAPGQTGQAASSSAAGSRQLPAPAWLGQLEEGLQVLELLVHGVVRPGLLQLEGWCARLLAWRWQVAVVDQPAVATELSQHFGEAGLQPLLLPATLQSPLASKNDMPVSASVSTAGVPPADQLKVDDLMTDLGCWLEFSAAMDALGLKLPGSSPSALPAASGGSSSNQLAQPADASNQAIIASRQLPSPATADSGLPQLSEALMQACRSVAYQEQMVDTAVQLLGYSCGTAWPATASMLLDGLLRLGLTWQGVRNLTTQHSLTLLHRAVCSGSHSMVQLVAGWGDAHGVPWQWSEADPGSGITPLHLAAMLPAGGVGGSGSLHLDQLMLASGGSSGPVGAMAAAIDTAGSDSLADWILTEFDAACRFWHGATDAQGVTPADVLVAVNRSPAGSALVTPNGGVNTHQLGPWSERMVQQRLEDMQAHASNGSSSGGQPSNRTGGEITIDQVRNAGVVSRQEAVEGWILNSASKVLPEEVSMGSWHRDSGTFLLDLPNGSSSGMPAGPSGSGGLPTGPGPASRSPPASRNLPTQEPAAAATITGLRAGVPASVAAPPSGPVTGTSKAASRLEAELQLVQAALAPQALLRASFVQFTSRRLETAFVGWLTNKRQRLRRLLPGLMACVFATAFCMELKQGTDPRGIWTFLSFAVPWVALLWHGWLNSKTTLSRMYDEETWVAVVLWHLLVRGLQAADVLHVPVSVRTFVYRGGDAMSEGAVQVFFLVRTQRMALLRLLYSLSAIALYLRGGLPIANASIIALSGNAACMFASWLLDLTNRRHFLQHLVAMLEQQQRQELQQRQQRQEAQAAQAAGQGRVASPSSRLRNGHTVNGLTSRSAARPGMQKA